MAGGRLSASARAVPAGRALRGALLWAVLAVPALGTAWLGLTEPQPWWRHAGASVVLAVAAAVSRKRPVPALLLAAGLGLAASPSLFTLSYGPALSVLGYLLGRRSAAPCPARSAFAGIAAVGTALVLLRGTDPVIEWLVLIGTLLFGGVFPWLTGRYRRQYRELVAAGWSRAAQLEREQEIVADRARLRERARIARDMHDSLGHELSLIALRAGALQVAPGLDPAHRTAAADLREAAAAATDRLHDIIGVLRDPEPGPGPGPRPPTAPLVPADETIPALVERAATSGLRVTLRAVSGDGGVSVAGAGPDKPVRHGGPTEAGPAVTGRPVRVRAAPGDGGAVRQGAPAGPAGPAAGGARQTVPETDDSAGAVPAGARPGTSGAPTMAERAAYRVVQEALTNAAKHAPGAEVEVTVERGPHETVVTVVNGPAASDGPARRPLARTAAGPVAAPGRIRAHTRENPATTPSGTGAGTGTGLLGLRERAALAGGECVAGPYEGGFRVVARLPHAAARGGEAAVFGDTGDGHAFARARRAARRRVVVPFAVAGAGAALFVAGAFGWYAYIKTHSVLTPAAYAGLRVGAPYAAVEPVLPELTVTDPPADRAPVPPPPGAECRYYRSTGELFVSVDHFRLCFRDGRLVAKHAVPRAGGPGAVQRKAAQQEAAQRKAAQRKAVPQEVVQQEQKEWVR
ncbi:nitrate/nitrite sensor protein NarX [Streptomyces netropsis]|nr:nitrate/nitrite sensor protein NarX [Streptomyces netropsis]